MQIIQHILVTADGVHIGVEPFAGIKAVIMQGHALPLGKRLHDLCVSADVRNIEVHRALVAVQVVIQTGGFLHKQRRRNAEQIQICGQLILKQAFEQADGLLCVIDAEQTAIVFGDMGVHLDASLSVRMRITS